MRARIAACVVVAVAGAVGGALGGLALVGALYPSVGDPGTVVRVSERLAGAVARLPETSAAARAVQRGVHAPPRPRAHRPPARRHVTHPHRDRSAPRAPQRVAAAVVAPVIRRVPVARSVPVVRPAPVAPPARSRPAVTFDDSG